MDALKDWVRNLVLLVLLASCLELLLPMGGMKKFVKMTMGLLIVLATLRPIFSLLGQPVTVNTTLFDEPDEHHLPTLSEIMTKAGEFQAKNRTLASDEVKSGLAAEAARAARAVDGVADAHASVDLQEADGEVKIKTVVVTVTPGKPGGMQPVLPVAPVQPVQAGGAATPAATAGPRELTSAEQKLADAVRQEVADRLGLHPDPNLIRVLVEHQPETQRR